MLLYLRLPDWIDDLMVCFIGVWTSEANGKRTFWASPKLIFRIRIKQRLRGMKERMLHHLIHFSLGFLKAGQSADVMIKDGALRKF